MSDQIVVAPDNEGAVVELPPVPEVDPEAISSLEVEDVNSTEVEPPSAEEKNSFESPGEVAQLACETEGMGEPAFTKPENSAHVPDSGEGREELPDQTTTPEQDDSEEAEFYRQQNLLAQANERVWNEDIVDVREGQLKISLAAHVPPIDDDLMSEFCTWLDRHKLPVIVSNYPYVMRTGARVDLSDNCVGPRGIAELLATLRKHRVSGRVAKFFFLIC
jgi:hypothetical protein